LRPGFYALDAIESGSEGADADSASENATTTMKVDKGVEKSDVMCDILLQSIACWCGCVMLWDNGYVCAKSEKRQEINLESSPVHAM